MAVKVAINGFGRIGRNVLRAIIESGRTDIEVVALNDLGPVETNAHLMRYDSVHGRFPGTVTVDGDTLDVGRGPIRVTAIRNPAELPWGDVDVALECTGIFASKEKAGAHLDNGSKRVLISAPAGGADKTIVYGVNHGALTADDRVVSNASCTTNCLAPVAYVLNNAIGIDTGFMTTIHSYTGDQPTLDVLHKDLYRGRAAAMSMIPTTTGAAKAVGTVYNAGAVYSFAGLSAIDCNSNEVSDACDILAGTSPDANGNGIPDECEGPACGDCPTDVNGDGSTGPFDLAFLLGNWGPCIPGDDCECLDANDDRTVGPFDLAVLLGAWGPCE